MKKLAFSILGICSILVSIWGFKSLLKAPKLDYLPVAQVVSKAEAERVIRKSVRISEAFSIEKILSLLTARKILSEGQELIVYRFNFPETCGKAGCLYVVAKPDQTMRPLQLFELLDGGDLFVTSPDQKLKVLQPINGRVEDYEIN